MAAVRTSHVSASGTWFQRGSRPSIKKRRVRPESGVGNASIFASKAPSGASTRQRPFSKDTQKTSQAKVKASQQQKNPKSEFPNTSVVSTAKTTPLWLQRLYAIHRYSSIAGFALVTTTLAVYGFTVYTQELWSQSYHRLQKLQRDERQITTTNAILTNKMAEEAERQSAGLVSPTPSRTIFLSPVPKTAEVAPLSIKPTSQPQQPASSALGY
ncbi:hypothetical protein [Nostoc sp. TCL26-01]|uniref:hypothetical protein n=1 Tax=Nostoc sp. TCL26-01 TaxID=2576904 RepID=UPI0015B816C3|nr:hypothetical protein [Nostoc sp. TCL26-01]QLE55263.1 hypothetical protein FD725_06905 [Nostoc sp. TCL26-01]